MMPTGFHKRAFVNIVSAIKASENSKKITLVPATHEASRQQRSQRNRHHGGRQPTRLARLPRGGLIGENHQRNFHPIDDGGPPEVHTLIAAFTGCNDRKLC